MNNYQEFSMDDIIFEGRNKQYGAYQLRQSIDRHSGIGLMITISAFTTMLLIYTLNPFHSTELDRPIEVFVNPQVIDIPKQEITPPKPIAHVTPPTSASVMANPNVIPVPDIDVITTTTTSVPSQVDLIDKVTSPIDLLGTGKNIPTEAPTERMEVVPTTSKPAITDKIVSYTDVMPSYIGGKDAMMEYLRKNIQPFSSDVEKGVSGKVILRFYIDTDGTVRNPEVMKDDIGGRCAEAAINAIKKMPKWNAGRQNGTPVKVYFTLPVTFDFQRN